MNDSTELSDLVLQRDVDPPELEAEVEEWINKLYEGSAGQPSLVNRYWWIRNMFRRAVQNEADVDEMMNETVFKYLGPVRSSLWAAAAGHLRKDEDTLMPAIRWVAKQLGRRVREVARECVYEHQHEDLIDRYYGIDRLTKEDLEEDRWREQILAELGNPFAGMGGSRPAPGAPVDPERLAFENPKAMIGRIAKNVLIDHLRKLKAEKAMLGNGDPMNARDESPGANPHAQIYALEMHNAYLAALRKLPPVQRAAWILCRDPLLLTDDEAEALLRPALSGPQAKRAAKKRPMTVEDAAEFFGRDLSPDAAKAARKLQSSLRPSERPRRSH